MEIVPVLCGFVYIMLGWLFTKVCDSDIWCVMWMVFWPLMIVFCVCYLLSYYILEFFYICRNIVLNLRKMLRRKKEVR